ncbi:hypothetical protein EF847_17345 [Actinobacteria bacterium YIM 96077]|uniref:VOC domain-containing protein n=1 Tax=Phytoactinopolyspora halophila TaxID=1981511 RepID=A0A329QTW9_9ACTN|nr:SRPBCC domain-containing protein [Phytoactinopolyspora halophila]AYY14200.1 hypothetical protein EF847_17345 [Actinobacteria bacterium YIM 96077]RAW14742.1 hypothetical protein DPM12_09570 [Phytoactinopolyspora halophila]
MSTITRTVTVHVEPMRAFTLFTADMDAWLPRDPHAFNYPDRAVGVELEPGVGGRWREIWHDGHGYEMGRVLAWEPGERLLLTYRHRSLPEDLLTEIDIRFDAVPRGTRVTFEHRGLERLPVKALHEWSGRAWRRFMAAFAAHVAGGHAHHTHEAITVNPMSTQAVTPILFYADGIAAMDWLAHVFGFVEHTRWLNDDGTLARGEMTIGDGVIMLASGWAEYESPRWHREHCTAAASWSKPAWVINGVLVRVPDVDEHYAHAVSAGATILSEPEDRPYGRSYRAEDLEGHRWMFESPAVA